MDGANAMRERLLSADYKENPALQYAAARNIMLRKNKKIEILVNYEPSCHYLSEWWKQLMGESEGKDHRGLFPSSVDFTTDLHSLGQFIQEGQVPCTLKLFWNREVQGRDCAGEGRH